MAAKGKAISEYKLIYKILWREIVDYKQFYLMKHQETVKWEKEFQENVARDPTKESHSKDI